VNGYPSGQDVAILLTQDYLLHCARTISLKFIDIKNPLLTKLGQYGQDGWILTSFNFCKFLDQNRTSKKQY